MDISKENRAFAEMLKAATERLRGRDAQDVAEKSGAAFDAERSEIRLPSLGGELCVAWPECEIRGVDDGWHRLVALHYLHRADGTGPEGRLIPFGAMKGGMIRGGGYDRQCAAELSRMLTQAEPMRLERACRMLGGRLMQSNADLCAEISFLPNFPLTLKVWYADEEIEASARLMPDVCADHNLSVEDAVTAGMIVLQTLQRAYAEAE